MVEGGGENFEGLLMGNVSETTSETDEQFAQRVAAAQAKLQKVKKDEQKSKSFDHHLAKLIPTLSQNDLQFVIFLINHEVPSLTILALLSLHIDAAYEICYGEFHALIEEHADFSTAKIPTKEIEEKISWWWSFILASDHISPTLRLSALRDNTDFLKTFSQFLSHFLQQFLEQSHTPDFDQTQLKTVLQKYKDLLFTAPQ